MGFSCLKATEPLWGDSVIFTTKSLERPGTHLIDLGRIKGWVHPVANDNSFNPYHKQDDKIQYTSNYHTSISGFQT